MVVIGGGNVAMDCTRTAIRMGAEKVTVVYRRRRGDMTALPDEVEGAIAEGAEVLTLGAPAKIETDHNGNVVSLLVQPQIVGAIDAQGRPRPGNASVDPGQCSVQCGNHSDRVRASRPPILRNSVSA